jgi:hypothetical protein
MPWWAPLAGLVGTVAVYTGLKLVGAGMIEFGSDLTRDRWSLI